MECLVIDFFKNANFLFAMNLHSFNTTLLCALIWLLCICNAVDQTILGREVSLLYFRTTRYSILWLDFLLVNSNK